jgi:hypothetical protein
MDEGVSIAADCNAIEINQIDGNKSDRDYGADTVNG